MDEEEQQIEVSKKTISSIKKPKNRKRHHTVPEAPVVPTFDQDDDGVDNENLLKKLDVETLKNSQAIEKERSEHKRRGSISQVKILATKRPLGYRVFAIGKATYIILR